MDIGNEQSAPQIPTDSNGNPIQVPSNFVPHIKAMIDEGVKAALEKAQGQTATAHAAPAVAATVANANATMGNDPNETKSATKLPLQRPYMFRGEKSHDVKQWLRIMSRYLDLATVPKHQWGKYTITYLEGEALPVWEAEASMLESKNEHITFENVSNFLISNFASLLPARDARQRFDQLTQTGTVAGYVRDMKKLVHLMKDTNLQVSKGDVIWHFIKGLKQNVKSYVEDNAPESEWWTTSEAVFGKARNYELNHSMNVGRAHVANLLAPPPRHYVPRQNQYQRGYGGPVRRSGLMNPRPMDSTKAYIPPELWAERKRMILCQRCGKNNHATKDHAVLGRGYTPRMNLAMMAMSAGRGFY